MSLEPRDHRVLMYVEYEFAPELAEQLADVVEITWVKDRRGTSRAWRAPLHHLKVKKALDAAIAAKVKDAHDKVAAVFL